MIKSLLTTLGLSACLSFVAPAHAGNTTYQQVDFPGSANTALYAVNDQRHYVGAEKDAAGKHHAIWFDGSQLNLLDPGGPVGNAVESWAYSINRNDDIAGTFVDAAGQWHGFIRHGSGALEVVDHPDGVATQAYGINAKGSLIGLVTDGSGVDHAWVRRGGSFAPADLPGALATIPLSINNLEEIAGEYLTHGDTLGSGFIQQRKGSYRLFSAPGAAPDETYFISINDHQLVLGAYVDPDGNWVNFVRRGRSTTPFNLPDSFGAGFVSAQTINNGGDIVGYFVDGAGVAHGFVAWTTP